MIRFPNHRRSGATLIELLVVMALIIIIATITILVFPRFGESHAVHRSADRASGWLIISKMQARRDGAPRGVRFLINPPTHPIAAGHVTEAQYIEVPEPWVPNPLQESNPSGGRIAFVYWTANGVSPPDPVPGLQAYTVPRNSIFRRVYFISNTPSDLAEFDQRVVAGDTMLVLPEFGEPHRIIGFVAGAVQIGSQTVPGRLLTLETYPDLGSASTGPYPPTPLPVAPAATAVTYKYSFRIGPRPILGEPILQLGSNTIINVSPTGTPPTTIGVNPQFDGVGNFFDVIFAPSGQVIDNPNGLVCLWVRNPEKVPHPRYDLATLTPDRRSEFDAAGDQVLICVTTRTGFVANQPVAPPPPAPAVADPHLYAKDGLNTGF